MFYQNKNTNLESSRFDLLINVELRYLKRGYTVRVQQRKVRQCVTDRVEQRKSLDTDIPRPQ